MSEYHVGDKVLIKNKDWYEGNADSDADVRPPTIKEGDSFVSCMRKYCGQWATITNVGQNNRMHLDIDNGSWNYSPYMFDAHVKMKNYDVGGF